MDENVKHVAKALAIPVDQVLKQAGQLSAIKKTIKLPEQLQQVPPPAKPFSGAKQLLHNRFMGIVSKTKEAVEEIPAYVCDADTEGKVHISKFMEQDTKLGRPVLTKRPSGQPSILQECITPIKLIIQQDQSPGDILMLTAAVRDLHRTYPGLFVTCMSTSCTELWENNPYHTKLDPKDPYVMTLRAGYTDAIARSNAGSYHFIHGFRLDLESKLGVRIEQGDMKGDLYLSGQEKAWLSQVWELKKKNIPFWLIDAGTKSDFTNKQWEHARFQQVVDAFPGILFVQIGAGHTSHRHPPLTGDNVLNLVGKTSMRQLVRLMYHAAGVVTPVSFPMHLSASVDMHPRYNRKYRPCVVIAGGREPAAWEAYSMQQYLHNCGSLPCCANGGCWKSRIDVVGDGDKKDFEGMCERPYVSTSGQLVPLCMEMITVDMVKAAISMYTQAYDYSSENEADWKAVPYDLPDKAVRSRLDGIKKSMKQAEAAVGKQKVQELLKLYSGLLKQEEEPAVVVTSVARKKVGKKPVRKPAVKKEVKK